MFSEGMDWAKANMEYVETEATVYEGEGQPLMDLTYSWNPKGELQIVKVGQDADGKTGDKKPLEGAVFEITSKTTGESFRIKTDEEGFASSGQVGDLPGLAVQLSGGLNRLAGAVPLAQVALDFRAFVHVVTHGSVGADYAVDGY